MPEFRSAMLAPTTAAGPAAANIGRDRHIDPTSPGIIDYHAIARAREQECRTQARAYAIWLSSLRPFNFILVVGAAILSTIAGATILASEHAGNLPAYLALASAILTVIHTRLDCDVHQTECHRLRSAYESHAYRYRLLELVDNNEDLQSQLRELDSAHAALHTDAKATPPGWAMSRAKKHQRIDSA